MLFWLLHWIKFVRFYYFCTTIRSVMNRIFHIFMFLSVLLTIGSGICSAAPGKGFTIIIDAGHGGDDCGAPGTVTNEKSINLAVALELGKLFKADKDVKIIYTRSADRFVTLQGRADIANRADGDLFVSIHTNSVDKKSKNRTTVRGAAVYTLGLDKSRDNLAVAMRENSVMKLENDYTTTYQGFDPTSAESYIIFEMSQNKHLQQSVTAARYVLEELSSTAHRKNNGVRQANFWVLLKTAMPSMLIELDFICNPTEEKFMDSSSGQKQLAQAIYNGITAYRKRLKSPATQSANRNRRNKTDVTQNEVIHGSADEKPNDDAIIYKIQFLTAPKKLPRGCHEFKGLDPVDSYFDRGMRKYTFGNYSSPRDASQDLKKVKAIFPDAFLIKTRGGQRIK